MLFFGRYVNIQKKRKLNRLFIIIIIVSLKYFLD